MLLSPTPGAGSGAGGANPPGPGRQGGLEGRGAAPCPSPAPCLISPLIIQGQESPGARAKPCAFLPHTIRALSQLPLDIFFLLAFIPALHPFTFPAGPSSLLGPHPVPISSQVFFSPLSDFPLYPFFWFPSSLFHLLPPSHFHPYLLLILPPFSPCSPFPLFPCLLFVSLFSIPQPASNF